VKSKSILPRFLIVLFTIATLSAACASRPTDAPQPSSGTTPVTTLAVQATAVEATAAAAPAVAETVATESVPTAIAVAEPTTAPTTAPTTEPTVTTGEPITVVNLLREGGYVIYFRHAATDRTQTDTDLSKCETQRNLNEEGRAQSTAIGEAFRTLQIPVGRVIASPYCRTQDTARLAFGNYEKADSYSDIIAVTRDYLSRPPEPGPNAVIVAHGMVINSVAGLSIAEGDAAIFKPRSEDDRGLIAIVPARQWAEWAQEAGATGAPTTATKTWTVEEFPVPSGTRPHDVAPAPDGSVWFTAQGSGELGKLDPQTGEVKMIKLPAPSAPHGVIVGPDGAPWITDSGQNAIVRVDPATEKADVFPLPDSARGANLNTAAFDSNGVLWFTGQTGYYGRVDPKTGKVDAWRAPRGRGQYGITTTPNGDVYYASLAGSHIARIDTQTGEATPIDPPTPGQGARRVWSDSKGRIWVSEWNAGQVGLYDPATNAWREWKLPGDSPRAYAVYVDDQDIVWLSDFEANAMVRFDPATEKFDVIPLPSENGAVRQILGRPGEVWGAESGASKLIVIRTN
jgi:virginiamycin B lyase